MTYTLKITREPAPYRLRTIGSGATFRPAVMPESYQPARSDYVPSAAATHWTKADDEAQAALEIIPQIEDETLIWARNAVKLQSGSKELFQNAHAAYIARLNDMHNAMVKHVNAGYEEITWLANNEPRAFLQESLIAETLGKLDKAAKWIYQLRQMSEENQRLAQDIKNRRDALWLIFETLKKAPELLMEAAENALAALLARLQALLQNTTGFGIGGLLALGIGAAVALWLLAR